MGKIKYNKGIFSKNLADLMTEKKLKQAAMAEVTGISQSTISRYLRGSDKTPLKINSMALAHYFNVNLAWLLAGHGPKHPPKPYEFEETQPISTVVEQKGLHAKTRRVKTEEGEVAVSLYKPDFPAIDKKDFETCAKKGCWAAEIGMVFANEKELALRMCKALDYIQVVDRVTFEDILRKIFGSYEVLRYKESKKNSS